MTTLLVDKKPADVDWSYKSFCETIINFKKTKDDKTRFEILYDFSKKNFPENGKFTVYWLKNVLLKIDKLWFEDKLFKLVTEIYGGIHLHLSVKESNIAGYILQENNDRDIAFYINQQLFIDLFSDNKRHGYHSGGLVCKTRLVCLLHVIVHETVHIALSLCEKQGHHDDKRHHGKVFSRITKEMFNHQDQKHGLIKGLNHEHDIDYIKKNIKVGQRVHIFHGDWIPATIDKIGRKKVFVTADDGHKYAVHAGLINI